MSRPRQELLEDEWLLVRHSGEIPEIALHSAFYYLTADPNGPRLQLSVEETRYLRDAAVTRYQEIIRRDLCYENRELTVYRGVRRAIFNWHRFVVFCERQDISCHNSRRPGMAECHSLQGQIKSDRSTTAEALLVLLKKITHATNTSLSPRSSATINTQTPLAVVFNCSAHDLTLFARELGIAEEQIPQEIHLFCHE
jgi:wobble nucleotide-excising tRNase